MENSNKKEGHTLRNILITLGSVLGLYALYYGLIRKPEYKFLADYPVPLTPAELGVPAVQRKVGGAIEINPNSFKKGDIVTGVFNKSNNTLTVTLAKFNLPDIKRDIPMANLEAVNNWF